MTRERDCDGNAHQGDDNDSGEAYRVTVSCSDMQFQVDFMVAMVGELARSAMVSIFKFEEKEGAGHGCEVLGAGERGERLPCRRLSDRVRGEKGLWWRCDPNMNEDGGERRCLATGRSSMRGSAAVGCCAPIEADG
ncbi:DUF1697 domain-containing protein [Sesbania bispinosa]|nr:DUF1697 domain-containing protein [Sesbania bispinosa]